MMTESKPTRLRDFTNLSILFASILAGIAVVAFYNFGKIGMGEIASFSIFCIYLVAFATWEIRDRNWYFPFATFFVTAHFIATYLIGNLNSFPFFVMFPFAAIDVFGTIHFVNKLDLQCDT